MLSSTEFYTRYLSITVPSFDGQSDLATGIRIDRYRLGAEQPFTTSASVLPIRSRET